MDAPTITTIRLYGVLGKKYGREYRLAHADTPRKAVRALDHLKPGFASEILRVKGAFRVRVGQRKINARHVDFPTHGKTIHITPLYAGAAGKALAIGEAILGVVLVVVGILGSEVGLGFLIPIGAGLALGGVAALLSPVPSVQSDSNAAAHKASYQFNGPVNTIAQGSVHPISYGSPITGSAVVSAGIYNVDITPANSGNKPSGGGGGPGGYSNTNFGPGVPIWSDLYKSEY